MNPIEIRLDGAVVEPTELLRLEVERARRMMALMMRKLGPQGMADLFAAEIQENADKLVAGFTNRSLSGAFARAPRASSSTGSPRPTPAPERRRCSAPIPSISARCG
jgi:hypothetical protein